MICKLYVSPLIPSPNWKYTGVYGRVSLTNTIQVKDMNDDLIFEHQIVKMTQLSKFFYAFATMDFLVGLSFEINEFPDELFKDTLASLTKEKRKPKQKKVDKSMISGPTGFQHVSHVGYAKGKGLDVNNVPPEWLETFKKAGLTNEQLQDPKTAKFVMKFMQEHSGEAPVAKRPPPPPPSRRRVPEVPPAEQPSLIQPEINKKPPIKIQPPPPAEKTSKEQPPSLPPTAAPELPPPNLPRRISKDQPDLPPPNLPRRISKDQPNLPPPVAPVVVQPDPSKKEYPPPTKKQNVPDVVPPIPQMTPPVSSAPTMSTGGGPPPPPGPPPPFSPPSADTTPKAPKPKAPITAAPVDLLSAIKSAGVKSLKKVETTAEETKKFGSSMAGGNDLAGALASALADRNKVLTTLDSDEEEPEDEGEWSD